MNNENRKVILLIDDERPVRESYKNYLEDYDFEIIEASGGEKGLKAIKENHIDLVLLDLRMPGMDGFSVLKSLKDNNNKIPVVVVSGTGVVTDTVKALHLGAWDFILKPIEDMDVFMHTITQCLERADLIKKNKEYRKHLEENNAYLTKTIAGLVVSQRKEIQSEKMKLMTNLLKELAEEITDPISVGLIASSNMMSRIEDLEKNIVSDIKQEYLVNYVNKQKSLNEFVWNNIKKSAESLSKFKNVVENGTAETESTFRIKDTINDVCSIFRSEIDARGIKINVDCNTDLEIISQHSSFYQIFYNLIQNSLFHAFNGQEDCRIDFIVTEHDDKLNIIYRDNGMGIPSEILDRVYDPFFTTKKSEKTMGFGLTIVYNLLTNNLKGSIEMESKENMGLAYYLSIPMFDMIP